MLVFRGVGDLEFHWICLLLSVGALKIPKDPKKVQNTHHWVRLLPSDGVLLELPRVTIQTESAELALRLFG